MTGVDLFGGRPPLDSAGHFCAKYDSDYTYFAFDITGNTKEVQYSGLATYWDTGNVGEQASSAEEPDFYNLIIENRGGRLWTEVDASVGAPYKIGTPLKQVFSRGPDGDYDWAHSFAPSPNSQAPHTQWELKIKNSILQKNLNKPPKNFNYFTAGIDYVGVPYIVQYPRDGSYFQVFYKAEPLPEPSDLLTIGGLMLSVPIVTRQLLKKAKESKVHVTRRQFLRPHSGSQKS
jgi:hypothetical protein